jgi:hypothetical protein
MAGRSGRNGRIEPFDKPCELFGHASVLVVGIAAEEVDHLAIAFDRLSAIAARLVDHSKAIPAIVHVGEADQQVAGGCLRLVELGGANKVHHGIGGGIKRILVGVFLLVGSSSSALARRAATAAFNLATSNRSAAARSSRRGFSCCA